MRADRRQEFVDTALQVFDRQGAANTSLRDVIGAMNGGKGVGMSVFYYYFESKDDLVNACLASYFDRNTREAITVLDNPSLDVQDTLDGIAAPLVDVIRKLYEIFAEKENWYNYLGTNLNLVNGFLSRIITHLAQALDRWLERGDLPRTRLTDAVDTTTLAWLIADGMASVISNGKAELDPSQKSETHTILFGETVAVLSQLLDLPLKVPQTVTSARGMTARC